MQFDPSGAPPPWPPPWPAVPPRRPRGIGRTVLLLLACAFVALAGYLRIGDHTDGGTSDRSQTVARQSATDPAVSAQARAISRRLDDSIVNITTRLSNGGAAAGTGFVISSSGLVLTNNHVIANTTAIQVENSADGSMHRATVVGYSTSDDVAVIQVQGVSDLVPVPVGDASALEVGDEVVALGNAGGQGGAPAIATGSVTNLGREIQASDDEGGNVETLRNLIEVDAPIEAGDSGGPLTDGRGRVIGMDTAASRGNRPGFDFVGGRSGRGYAIPIQDVLSIARSITSGRGGPGVHIGAHRGILGVSIRDRGGDAGDGVSVEDVAQDSGAEAAGIEAGDLLVRVGGADVGSISDLNRALSPFAPGDRVRVVWLDRAGDSHTAAVTLQSGPPA